MNDISPALPSTKSSVSIFRPIQLCDFDSEAAWETVQILT